MKILVAPLNWGLGHATRCIPIIRRLLEEGNEVVTGGDGDSLALLHSAFPDLQQIHLPHLALQYGKGKSQVWAMLRALPVLIRFSIADHMMLKEILALEHFDQIISDNRFDLYNKDVHCIYMTHQLMIKMPKGLKWLEPSVHRVHMRIIRNYDECWIPDYADAEKNLSGDLSHKYPLPKNARFIGPLSRFEGTQAEGNAKYQTVAVLSGLEPQRSMLENELIERYKDSENNVLIVRGIVSGPITQTQIKNITLIPKTDDEALAGYLLGAEKIIARSGYSSIMDFECLGVMKKVEFVPTPGQTEQEYLAQHTEEQKDD